MIFLVFSLSLQNDVVNPPMLNDVPCALVPPCVCLCVLHCSLIADREFGGPAEGEGQPGGHGSCPNDGEKSAAANYSLDSQKLERFIDAGIFSSFPFR